MWNWSGGVASLPSFIRSRLGDRGGKEWHASEWGFRRSGWISTAASINAADNVLYVPDRTLTTKDVGLIGWLRGIGQFGAGPTVPAMIHDIIDAHHATLTRTSGSAYNGFVVNTVANATAAFAPPGDGDAYQNMLNDLASTGKRGANVGIIPPGVYMMDGRTAKSGGDPSTDWQIRLRDWVQVHGAGVNATTLLTPSVTAGWVNDYGGAVTRFAIKHLRVLGAGTAFEILLSVAQVTDADVEDLLLDGGGWEALRIVQCIAARLRHIKCRALRATVQDTGTGFTCTGGVGVHWFQGCPDGDAEDILVEQCSGSAFGFDAGHGNITNPNTAISVGSSGWTCRGLKGRDTGTWVGNKLDVPNTIGIPGHTDGVPFGSSIAALNLEGSRDNYIEIDLQRHAVALVGTAGDTMAGPAISIAQDQSASANPPDGNTVRGRVENIGGPKLSGAACSHNDVDVISRNVALSIAAGAVISLSSMSATPADPVNNPGDPSYTLVNPAGQLTTNTETVLAGSAFNTVGKPAVYLQMSAAGNAITWAVYGAANGPGDNWAGETLVQAAASVAAGGTGSYSTQSAPFPWLRTKVLDTIAGSHGTATVLGWASPSGKGLLNLDTVGNLVTGEHWQDNLTLTPAAQLSTDTPTVIAGSSIDTTGYDSIAMRVENMNTTSASVTVAIFGATLADYSDEVSLQSTNVSKLGHVDFLQAAKTKTYYRIKISATTPGTQATMRARVVAYVGHVSVHVSAAGGSAKLMLRNLIKPRRMTWRPGTVVSISGTLANVPLSGPDANRYEWSETDDIQDGIHQSFGPTGDTRWGPRGLNVLAQRPPTGSPINPQEWQIYARYDDASNYARVVVRTDQAFNHSILEEVAGSYSPRGLAVGTGGAGHFYWETGGIIRWSVNGSSGHILSNADATYDLGDATHRVRDLFMSRDLVINGGGVGSGHGVIALGNAATVPSTNPASGGILYTNAGALVYRGSAGTVTPLAAA